MTPQEHYYEAERLISKGRDVSRQIASATDDYHPYGNNGGLNQGEWVSQRRHDLKEEAARILARAQVHATLATIPLHAIEVSYAGEVGL